MSENIKDGRCTTCGAAMGYGSRCLCPPRPLSREESQAICKQNAELLDKMVADSREKHMGELTKDISELSRLRSYVAAVTPLVEAAREYQRAQALRPGGAEHEVWVRARQRLLREARNLKLEVPRG